MLDSSQPSSSDRDGLLADFWEEQRQLMTIAYGSVRSTFFIAVLAGLIGTLLARGLVSEKGVEGALVAFRGGGGLSSPISIAQKVVRWDAENVRRGLYKPPYDMDPRHRQWNPQFVLDLLLEELRMVHDQQERRQRGGAAEVANELDPGLADKLPDYYKVNWHYMEGGWLSDRHARVFDFFSEVGLFGLNDASKRQALIPLRDFARSRRPSEPLRLMDVACGTGRFLTFVRDNHPTAHVTGVELSPNNVARATSDMAYFERFHSEARRNPPLTGSANFLWGRAEDLPAGEASHDVITTLQLFHELPPGVREKVVGEMYRALKPGGLAVCLDAFQGVGPISAEKEVVMRGFADSLYEPYYDSYIVLDMVGLFEEAGFVKVAQSHVHAQTCWTVRKP